MLALIGPVDRMAFRCWITYRDGAGQEADRPSTSSRNGGWAASGPPGIQRSRGDRQFRQRAPSCPQPFGSPVRLRTAAGRALPAGLRSPAGPRAPTIRWRGRWMSTLRGESPAPRTAASQAPAHFATHAFGASLSQGRPTIVQRVAVPPTRTPANGQPFTHVVHLARGGSPALAISPHTLRCPHRPEGTPPAPDMSGPQHRQLRVAFHKFRQPSPCTASPAHAVGLDLPQGGPPAPDHQRNREHRQFRRVCVRLSTPLRRVCLRPPVSSVVGRADSSVPRGPGCPQRVGAVDNPGFVSGLCRWLPVAWFEGAGGRPGTRRTGPSRTPGTGPPCPSRP